MVLSPVVIHLERRGEGGCQGVKVDGGLPVLRQVDVIVTYGAFRDAVVHGEASGMVGDVEADGLGAEVALVLIARSSDVQCVVAGFGDWGHHLVVEISDKFDIVDAFGQHGAVIVRHGAVYLDGVAVVPHVLGFYTRDTGIGQVMAIHKSKHLKLSHFEALEALVVISTYPNDFKLELLVGIGVVG